MLFKICTITTLTIIFNVPTKNHSKNIPQLEKPTQKPIQKIALKNSRRTIRKIFILIKAKSNLTRKNKYLIYLLYRLSSDIFQMM